jgi:hypothetical protein
MTAAMSAILKIGLDVHRNYEVLAEDMKHWLPGSANQKRQAVHA